MGCQCNLTYAQLLVGIQITFALSLGCVKASLCLLLLRIFDIKTFRWAGEIVNPA